ncbi:MAG: hypothetical protein HPY66_2533 [Firmicutes bacterium]|nr:hypothetical protein [Bacillota bacterium]
MNSILCGLAAGIIASFICLAINDIVLRISGDRAVVLQIPFIEETVKTLGAVILGGNLILCHMVFGAVEAFYDLYNSPAEYSLTASLLSLASHTAFGIVTYTVVVYIGWHFLSAVFICAIIHGLWNKFITGYAG